MSVSRIHRLLRMVTMLQGGRRYSANELAEELEVSRRTVFRDLNMLEMAHIPYYFDEPSSGYRISQHFFLPPVNLTLSEALAMLLMTGRLRNAKGLPLIGEATRAAVKIESVLPGPVRKHVGSLADRLSVSLGPVSRHEGLDGMFDELAAAIVDRHPCRLVYLSFLDRKQVVLDVRPVRLVFKARAWYLVAHSRTHDEIRTFKLGRIRKLTVQAGTFAPIEFDEDDHFGRAWQMIGEGKLYDIHLHFEPKVAGNVAEVAWHASQRVQWNDDGSLEFFVKVDGIGEITWWILGYGDQVEVISPQALRSAVVGKAKAMLGRYTKEAR